MQASETLGAATDLDEIKAYAVLPENIDATIESLKVECDALKSSNIQTELKRARDPGSRREGAQGNGDCDSETV